jgi:hypothetical protein
VRLDLRGRHVATGRSDRTKVIFATDWAADVTTISANPTCSYTNRQPGYQGVVS